MARTSQTQVIPGLDPTYDPADSPILGTGTGNDAPVFGEPAPKKPSKFGSRVLQTIIALLTPVILLAAAVRMVVSPLFLLVEYNRPGFPADQGGFTTGDRLHYGSYAVNYLTNLDGQRFLQDIVLTGTTTRAFTDNEVSHMADVKVVMSYTFLGAVGLVMLILLFGAIMFRRNKGGLRRGFFAGSLLTLALLVAVGVMAGLNWQGFFVGFHELFFSQGNWQFPAESTLIRLFPNQFWIDAGIAVGAITALLSVLLVVLTWPTRRRRGLPPKGSEVEV